MNPIDRVAKYAGLYRPDPPLRAAITFCAFGSYVAPVETPNCRFRVNVRAQVLFRPQRVVVAPSCAPFFDLVDFAIGNCSQRAEFDHGVSAEFFPPLPGDTRPKQAFPFGPDGTPAEFFPPYPIKEAEREACAKFVRGFGGDMTCRPGQDMILWAKNKTDAPQRFEAIVWGVFAE